MSGEPRTESRWVGRLTNRGHWLAVIGTALAVRAVFVFVIVHGMGNTGDAVFYSRDAVGIVHHFPGANAFFFPPGISYALAAGYALFGTKVVVAKLVVLLISVGAVAAIRLLAGLVLRDERNARRAGWIAALYPPAIFMSGDPFSHPLGLLSFTLFAALLVIAYDRRNWFAALGAGLAWGVGALTRPSALSFGLALVIVVFVIARGRRGEVPIRVLVGGLAAVIAMAALVIMPVAAFNSSEGQGLTIATNTEINLFVGNSPYTPLYKTSQLAQGSPNDQPPKIRDFIKRHWDPTKTPTPTRAQRSAMQREAIHYMTSHPLPTIARTFNRGLAFWGFDYYMSRQVENHYGLTTTTIAPMLAIEAGGSLAVLFLALLGALFARDRFRGGWAAVLLLLVGCYELPYLVAFSVGVYHFDIMGLLIPFAAVGIDVAWNWRRRPGTILLLGGAFALLQLEYAYFIFKYA